MKKLIMGLLLFILLLGGCGKEQSYEPEEINPDIDACVICNMSVAHVDYATQVILKDGTVYKFDDIGCMVEFLNGEGQDKEIVKKYVRDVETTEWIELEKASFAYHEEYWTPMAYGVLSFSSKERAEAFIESQGYGEMMSVDEVMKHDWDGH